MDVDTGMEKQKFVGDANFAYWEKFVFFLKQRDIDETKMLSMDHNMCFICIRI